MTRRNSILGAALLCALCFCAFGAASASAASGLTWHICEEATGTTGREHYSDSHCETTSTTGKFNTVDFAPGTKEVTVTGTETFVLGSTIAGIAIEIKCTTLGGADTITNVLNGTTMEAHGAGPLSFTGCTLTKPEKQECKVTIPTVEGVALTTSMATETGATTFTFTPKSELFVTITLSGCKTTALNGEKPVKGTASGVNEKDKRSTVVFSKTSGSKLTFGGQEATLVGKAHSVIKGTEKTVAPETETAE